MRCRPLHAQTQFLSRDRLLDGGGQVWRRKDLQSEEILTFDTRHALRCGLRGGLSPRLCLPDRAGAGAGLRQQIPPSAPKADGAEPCAAEARGVLSTMRAPDWRTWLLGAVVFAASTALVVLIALLLLGMVDLGLG